MKKLILFVGALLFTLSGFCQVDLKLSSNKDTLYLSSGIKFFVGQEILVGEMSKKNFVFIYEKDWQRSPTSLPRRFAGSSAMVTKIKFSNNVYLLQLEGMGLYRYYCEVYNAIKFGEIVCDTCGDLFKINPVVTTVAPVEQAKDVVVERINLADVKYSGAYLDKAANTYSTASVFGLVGGVFIMTGFIPNNEVAAPMIVLGGAMCLTGYILRSFVFPHQLGIAGNSLVYSIPKKNSRFIKNKQVIGNVRSFGY